MKQVEEMDEKARNWVSDTSQHKDRGNYQISTQAVIMKRIG
jgi:hypothetical protein